MHETIFVLFRYEGGKRVDPEENFNYFRLEQVLVLLEVRDSTKFEAAQLFVNYQKITKP